ncbi:hypothetical protein OAG48_00130 [bacterium]|nr:hypothetical protein [bacterium]
MRREHSSKESTMLIAFYMQRVTSPSFESLGNEITYSLASAAGLAPDFINFVDGCFVTSISSWTNLETRTPSLLDEVGSMENLSQQCCSLAVDRGARHTESH